MANVTRQTNSATIKPAKLHAKQQIKQQVKMRKAPAELLKKNRAGRSAPSVALIITAGIAACLLIAVMSLYPVLREYYIVVRTNEELNSELTAVLERNQKIQAQINSLQTPEGIGDRVREEFGWVKSGEQAVNITGLEISDSTTVLPATVKPGQAEVEHNVWFDFLDSLFGVEEKQEPEPIPDPFFNEQATNYD